MSKQLFANEKVMKQYLNALLCDEEPVVQDQLESVARLLQQVDEVVEAEPEVAAPVTEATPAEPVVQTQIESTQQEVTKTPAQRRADYFDGEFQALFFEVAGLTLAVPLKALGGIHQLGEVNQLFGRPEWFKGVMLNREEKLNVVDTARWVMPEKMTPELEEKLDYQYLIMLGNSNWGLTAERLVNNITLSSDDVKWRENNGKRPWLAGVIKEKMCALIDVDNLNLLLEQGLDSQDQ